MKGIDQGAVNRLARLIAMTTEDARQMIVAGQSGERLHHEVKLAAALAAQLARTLKLTERDVDRYHEAGAIARDVIAKAQAQQWCDDREP
jgi:hypothetical protein